MAVASSLEVDDLTVRARVASEYEALLKPMCGMPHARARSPRWLSGVENSSVMMPLTTVSVGMGTLTKMISSLSKRS